MSDVETAVTALGREVTRLTADLARVTGERDRARDLAAALEAEMAGVGSAADGLLKDMGDLARSTRDLAAAVDTLCAAKEPS